MASLAENLARVRERIAQAAARAGRDQSKIKLVAVSKGQGLKKIEEAVAAGVDILGENFIQEAREKMAALGVKVSWHFVGHLQTNKAKYAAQLFDLIHSLDSARLAQELNRQGEKLDKRLPVLVQINVSGEESKFGVERDRAVILVKEAASLPHLEVVGLMTLTPLFQDPEKCRPYYRALRHIRHQVASVMPALDLKELSMGMSADFEVAVEEGATLVRVGTAIFGSREKK